MPFKGCDIGVDIRDRPVIGLFLGKIEQYRCIVHSLIEPVECIDNPLMIRPLATESAGLFGIAPDLRGFELAPRLFESFAPSLYVKDTPSGSPFALACP